MAGLFRLYDVVHVDDSARRARQAQRQGSQASTALLVVSKACAADVRFIIIELQKTDCVLFANTRAAAGVTGSMSKTHLCAAKLSCLTWSTLSQRRSFVLVCIQGGPGGEQDHVPLHAHGARVPRPERPPAT